MKPVVKLILVAVVSVLAGAVAGGSAVYGVIRPAQEAVQAQAFAELYECSKGLYFCERFIKESGADQ